MARDYDESILLQYAQGLYVQARLTIILGIIRGAFIGFVIAAGMVVISAMMGGRANDDLGPFVVLMGGGAIYGYFSSLAQAFWYKVQAEMALCQVQIERNTRASPCRYPYDGPVDARNELHAPPAELQSGQVAAPPPPPVGPQFCAECGTRLGEGLCACETCGTPVAGFVE